MYWEVASGGGFQSGGKRVWRPEALEERNAKTGDWQMLSPVMDTNCETLGANDTASVGGWSGGRLAADGKTPGRCGAPIPAAKPRACSLVYVDVFPYP